MPVLSEFKPSPTVAEIGDFGDKNLKYSLLHWGMFTLTRDEWADHCRAWADWDSFYDPRDEQF